MYSRQITSDINKETVHLYRHVKFPERSNMAAVFLLLLLTTLTLADYQNLDSENSVLDQLLKRSTLEDRFSTFFYAVDLT
ncbi:hypothetical protein Btru_004024 [Bulinus truncatus]|nr:hypothetical protein Btru_004024 [Bulinus truncatus]